MNACENCKHWQGRPGRKWADCYRVLLHLVPDLGSTSNDFGSSFAVPFDPNDARNYMKYDENFNKLYRQARSMLPHGCRVQKNKGNYYYQTRGTFGCSLFCQKESQ